jgi:hypothetical protein
MRHINTKEEARKHTWEGRGAVALYDAVDVYVYLLNHVTDPDTVRKLFGDEVPEGKQGIWAPKLFSHMPGFPRFIEAEADVAPAPLPRPWFQAAVTLA